MVYYYYNFLNFLNNILTPNMTFNHDALLNGTALLAYSIIKLFEHTGNKAVFDHYHFDRI
jgi:hypothetical protein